MAELRLSERDIRLILKALITAQFPQDEQKDAFDLYNKLVAINNQR